MSRQRDAREAKALAFLKLCGASSAVEIGRAAVRGEDRARQMPWRGLEGIGMSIAIALVRRGLVQANRCNLFEIGRRQ